MSVPQFLSLDLLLISLMATVAVREVLIIMLPDTIAGPDGWLIRVPADR